MGPATPEQIAKRAPITTSRLHLELELHTPPQGTDEARWVVRAVPSMRELAAWPADAADVAQAAFIAAARLVAAIRAFSTRPHGTCPRCAGPLDGADPLAKRWHLTERWCPACKVDVVPAGPRVGAEEDAAQRARHASTQQAVELLRDRHP